MIEELLYSLVPILLLIGTIFVTATFVFLKSAASATVKFLLVPAAFAAAIAVPIIFVTMMGYSVPVQLPKKVIVLGHQTIVVANKKKSIEIWAREKKSTRLYVLPYSKDLEDKLNEAAKGRQRGLQSNLDQDSSGYQLRLLTPEDISPKGPPEPTQEEPRRQLYAT